MAEDRGLCTHFKYHQQKLVFFLSAMRHYRDALVLHGAQVHYETLSDEPFLDRFERFLKQSRIKSVVSYEVSDRFFEQTLSRFFADRGIAWKRLPSPGFLTTRERFASYLGSVKKPFMKTFYELQRKHFQVLLDQDAEPLGGRWSFDDENRERLPSAISIPETIFTYPSVRDEITREVQELVEHEFSDHPGKASEFWLPVTRSEATQWLARFITDKLENFGTYEDALSSRAPFLFHSVLTPFLNSGLLTPQEVIDGVLAAFAKRNLRLASVEGFVRQVIGWREFIFGIDRHFGEQQHVLNHFNHQRQLTEHWRLGTTELTPLDDAIRKALRWGYSHHIERLMVIGNFMVLSEIHPQEAYQWFMEHFIDSADWVMGPNVFGMGIFSDGGIFATKPYVCGSNYLLKMSDYGKGPWCDIADGLYWSFIAKHQKTFIKNPRMATMARAYDRLNPDRKEVLHRAAEAFRARVTR
jgi:deoxyribodipyrimidine photolyase-related protein